MTIAGARNLKAMIDRLIAAAGSGAEVPSLLDELWRRQPDPATAAFVLERRDRLPPPLVTCRVAILRSFTAEPLVGLLRAGGALSGIDLEVHLGGFNSYAQEVLDPESELYRFCPDVVLLAVMTPDLVPELWSGFADLEAAAVDEAVERGLDQLGSLVAAFRSRSQAKLVLHALDAPGPPSAGILDAQAAGGQGAAVHRFNDRLVELAGAQEGVHVLDYPAVVASYGRDGWYDPAKWAAVGLPFAAGAMEHLTREWLRFLHPISGRICKVLVTDLDNTLWGGVIGEDGIQGIRVGTGHPGSAHRDLQRAILDIHRRGVVLAVCSRNNEQDVMEALGDHPGMLLRPEHFAAYRIGWGDKAENLQAIADELNVGIDALCFLDDDPVQRAWVRRRLPEVTVVELPKDPAGYAAALRASPVFERLSLSAEDRQRGRYYVQRRQSRELSAAFTSLEDFYRSLEMRAEVAFATDATRQRVAQLTQRTNQFNLTTRRYSEAVIAELMDDSRAAVYVMRTGDRFGDNGIVGVAITRRDGVTVEIDTFLLSCRVLGRTLEKALLYRIVERSREAGGERLVGRFVPSKQNVPAAEFYPSHGFSRTAEQDGASVWELDLAAAGLACPEWVALAPDQPSGEPP